MENQMIVRANGGLDLFNPQAMEMAMKATEMFTKSSLVPEMYREGGVIKKGDPKNGIEPVTVSAEQAKANVFIAIDLANRIQANPLMVMQNLYIVEGKPSWSSSFLISTVNTCGRFKPLKFHLAIEMTDGKQQILNPTDAYNHPLPAVVNVGCVAYTSEKNAPEDKEHMLTSTKVTIKMAIAEGWYGKRGSKWQTMPEQMLRYRAAALWVRTYAPELANGMYTAEEQTDMVVDVPYTEEVEQKANMGGEIAINLEEEEQHIQTPEPEVKEEKPAEEDSDEPGF